MVLLISSRVDLHPPYAKPEDWNHLLHSCRPLPINQGANGAALTNSGNGH